MATAAAPEAQLLRRHSALSDMLAAGLPLAAASLACGLAYEAASKLADEAGFRAAQAGAKWLQALAPAQFAKMGRKLVRGVVIRALAEDKVSIVGLLLRQTKILEAPQLDRNGKRETESGASEDDYEGYALVEARGTLQLPLDVAFVTEDGAEVRTRVGGTIEPHGRMIRVPYTGTKALRGVVLDPDQKLLLDDDFTNNHAMIRGTREAPQNHVFALVTTLTSHLVSWLSP